MPLSLSFTHPTHFWICGLLGWSSEDNIFSWMANKPPIMICPGEVIATKSSGLWQDWEVARIIRKQVITIINSGILLSYLLSSWELLGTTQFTDADDKNSISPKRLGSIGQWQGPEGLSIQILDVSENSFLTNKSMPDSNSLWCWATRQWTCESYRHLIEL